MPDDQQNQPTVQDYTEIVRILLERGTDINRRAAWGRTALMIAADQGYLDIVRLLLDWEANVNVKDDRGYTALMYAAWKGHLDIVKALIDRGADVNAVDQKYDYTALSLAAGGPKQHDEREARRKDQTNDQEDHDDSEE